ncbi:MAG TPA: hypothetical protein VF808_06205 [Ktedonobacterales bacterium]
MATIQTEKRREKRASTGVMTTLARRKLRAFARTEAEFISGFRFVEDVHGLRRFSAFSVSDIVRYLHALYVCECKDHLLSVPLTATRYEGARALELLRGWQEGDTASVIAFIHRRLDDLPFAELTRAIDGSRRAGDQPAADRLTSGRAILLNRLFTLALALDALFAQAPDRLISEIQAEARRLGHTRAEIGHQLASLRGDLYRYAPHPALARRNMLLMNSAGLRITDTDGDRPGERTHRVEPGAAPIAPYAEAPIAHARTQVSLRWRAG